MSLVVVPNYISEEIYKRIDRQLLLLPELKDQRENIYLDLLNYFDEHGIIPDFALAGKKDQEEKS